MIQPDSAIHTARKRRIMRRDNGREAELLRHVYQLSEHALGRVGIEIARGLICQQHGGVSFMLRSYYEYEGSGLPYSHAKSSAPTGWHTSGQPRARQ